MADRYWVGGTASWDGTAGTKWATASGGGGGASVPTTADDVFFSALSTGTCTIATGNTGAKSINCTGFTGTIAGSAAISVAGSITLFATQTYTHSGTVTITGTGTLTTAGKSFSGLTVDGVGITVTLGDALNLGGNNLIITQGTFTTSASNYSVTAQAITSSNSNTRTITLNGSTVTLSGGTNVINFSTPTNLTFNAGTSQINCSATTLTFNVYSQTFYNVSFTSTSSGTRSFNNGNGANTFNNLTLTASALGLTQLSLAANQTVNGTFTCAGSSATNRGFVRSSTFGTPVTITANAISADDCDFRDITLAGTAAGASPTRAGDCGNNSGITLPAAKTVYWNLAGTQNWNATAWATTSNGTPAVNNFPLAQDTATFTNSGLAGTISWGTGYNIGTLDASGRTSAMSFNNNAACNIYGSYTLGSGVSVVTSANNQTFCGRGTQTFTSAGKTILFEITVDKPAGAFELGDATTTTNKINFTQGTLDAKNYNVTCGEFLSSNSNTRTLTMGSGLWTLSGTGSTVWFTPNTAGLTFNKDTANILLSNTTTSGRTFSGGNLTYNKLTIGGTTGTSGLNIAGSSTFSELASTKTVAHTISIINNPTITTWSVTGTAGNVVTVNSSSVGTQRTLTITNKTIDIDYLSVTDINSTNLNPVTFYAGANSTNGGNNTGVAFIARTTASPQNAHILTSGTTFTVPADWNSSNNNIYMIGAGAGGGSAAVSGNNRAAGGGGGGGAFTQLTNFTATPSGSVTYAIGTSAVNTDGGNTTWDSGTYLANGGLKGTAATTPTSAGGAGGTAQTVSGIITAAYAGGNGGAGAFGSVASTGYGSGAGGGAGGPNGVGGNGGTGFGSTTQANIAGGGGGGNGGGSNGGNAASATFGSGGNNFAGIGGATTVNTAGTFGGGGSGAVNTGAGGVGGSGIDILNTLGGAGGRGGGASGNSSANTGLYGGGGNGGVVTTAGGTANSGAGSQGVIFIVYTPSGGTTYFGSGSVNGSATVTGLGNYTASGLGSISASATVSTLGNIIVSVNGAIDATATVSALGGITFNANAAIDGTATVTALANKITFATGSIDGTATVSALGGVIYTSSASIDGTATVSALGGITFSAIGNINGTATVSALGNLVQSGVGYINGTATVSALGGLIASGIGYINGTASVSALGGLLNLGKASITANGTVTANGNLIFGGTASINGTTTVTADGYYIADGIAAISAFADVTALANYNVNGYAGITANGTVIANGVIQGEGWNPIPAGTETWTPVSVGSETWTAISPSTDTWTRIDNQLYVEGDYWKFGYVSENEREWITATVTDNVWLLQG